MSGCRRARHCSTTYRYTGQREEAAVGLYFYGARWYDPAIGRFLQPDTLVPDPANSQSLNRYAYTLNNPLKYTDPTGHWVETVFDIASVGFDIAAVKQDPSVLNIGALIVDAAAVIVPIVPSGAGWLARGGKAAVGIANRVDDVVDVAKTISKAEEAADVAADAATSANKADAAEDLAQAGAATSRATTILGENMRDRVIPFADATGARTLPFGTSAERWATMTPKERWHLNDGALRKRIGEGDQFRYIGIDPSRPASARRQFDLTRSELLRLVERGINYETVSLEEIMRILGQP